MRRITQDDIARLLAKIHSRPELYLGTKSLMKLKHFLDGFMEALCMCCETEEEVISLFPEGFQEWIAMKYDISSAHDWSSIITFYSINDAEAFDTFFGLLYEFLSLNEQERNYSNILLKQEKWDELRSEYLVKLEEIRND